MVKHAVSAHDVAIFLLRYADSDSEGELITNLKLQKLVYYCQGFHLALHNKPLFEEKIYAWQHGPVVEELYYAFNTHGRQPIPVPADADTVLEKFTEEQKDLIISIYGAYGQFSAWKLRDMTHDETPWRNAEYFEEITHDSLKCFFSTRIE